ncbi:MAG: zinc ribbon domain-containing protein [Thermodesulfobacteriota bacterium]|nr:zinc ribbon domain-containing protein [Thermodesulfobacteriota bacterium]
MPIYEYKCQKCNYEFEQLQKFSDSPLTQCPRCNGELKKLVSHSSFHLKGSGWYLTDYSKKNSPPETSGTKEKTAAAKPADKGPAKTKATKED